MHQVRNFVMRLSTHYILISILLLLRGISRDRQLFGVWVVAFVFTVLTVTLRRLLLTLALPLIIMTAGLFIFVVDSIILVLTAALTRLDIQSFWWALLGVLVMSSANIWIERALRTLGWFRDAEPGHESVMTKRSPRPLLRLTLLSLLLFGVIYSTAMAAQVFLALSYVTTRITVMTLLAVCAFVLFVAGIAWLVAEGLAVARRARFSLIATGLATLAVAIPAALLILTSRPPTPAPLPTPRPETAYWTLSTGSRIAYSAFEADPTPPTRNPIVYLHDFGRAVLDTDIAFFRRFRDAGFDVYLYDQVGCGLSERLDDIEAYTIERHVRDLEAIRETIQADRLILVGHAGGAEIAARYMVAHRDRVERVVFYSPTPLWEDQFYVIEESRTAMSPFDRITTLEVPPLVAVAVAGHSPRTAQAYVSQAAMTTWADRTTDEALMVCAGDQALAPRPNSPGYNPYAAVVGETTADRSSDPRPALRQLLVPTVLLRGSCDLVGEDVVTQYQEAIPYLRTYLIEEAGSMIHLSRPEEVEEILLIFLNQRHNSE